MDDLRAGRSRPVFAALGAGRAAQIPVVTARRKPEQDRARPPAHIRPCVANWLTQAASGLAASARGWVSLNYRSRHSPRTMGSASRPRPRPRPRLSCGPPTPSPVCPALRVRVDCPSTFSPSPPNRPTVVPNPGRSYDAPAMIGFFCRACLAAYWRGCARYASPGDAKRTDSLDTPHRDTAPTVRYVQP
jgi:hypothetical protein